MILATQVPAEMAGWLVFCVVVAIFAAIALFCRQ